MSMDDLKRKTGDLLKGLLPSGTRPASEFFEDQDKPLYKNTGIGNVLRLWDNANDADRAAESGRSNMKLDMFDHINLAEDSGMSDIKADVLLYYSQYLSAGISVVFILMNIVYINAQDVTCLFFEGTCTGADVHDDAATACFKTRVMHCANMTCMDQLQADCESGDKARTPGFLLMRWIFHDAIPGEKIIAGLELGFLWMLFLRTVRLSLQAFFTQLEVLRWVCVVQIFWQTIPTLTSFSLMRLLYYVTPCVLLTEVYYVVMWTIEQVTHGRCVAIWQLLWYVLTRTFCAIVGFDAFLVKYRMAAANILGHMTPMNLGRSCLFLIQLLGCVNLTWYVRQRLFYFIFGSDNGDMTSAQKAKSMVWNALVARRIFEKFNLFNAVVIMLGFDDYDFQVLVMENKPTEPTCPAGHVLVSTRMMSIWAKCSVCHARHPGKEINWCKQCSFYACDACKEMVLKEPPWRPGQLAKAGFGGGSDEAGPALDLDHKLLAFSVLT